MKEHKITKDQMLNQEKTRKDQTDNMRRANFKIPNEKSLQTGSSTYKNVISNPAEDVHFGEGRAELLTNLKKANIHMGNDSGLKMMSEAKE